MGSTTNGDCGGVYDGGSREQDFAYAKERSRDERHHVEVAG
jgi:hypothetical protein